MKVILAAVLLLSSTLFAAELQSFKLVNGQAKQWLHLDAISPVIVNGQLHVGNKVYDAPNGLLSKNINSTHFLLRTFSLKDKSGETGITIFDESGKKTGQFREPLSWDQPIPQFMFAGTSPFIFCVGFGREVLKLDYSGNVAKRFKLPEISPGSEGNIISRTDEKGGLYIAIVRPRRVQQGMAWQSTIYGLRENEFEPLMVLDKALTTFSVSMDGKMLACSVFEQQDSEKPMLKQSLLFGRDGKLIAKLNMPFSSALFTGDHVLLLDRFQFALIATGSGEELFRSAVNTSGFLNLSALILANDQIVVQSGKISDAAMQSGQAWSYQPLQINVYNFSGQLQAHQDIEDRLVVIPSMQLAQDGRSVFFGHSNGWSIYRWKNEN